MNKETIKQAIKRFNLIGIKHYSTVNVSFLAPNKRLDGKKILITGGSRGIGLYMAKKFLEEGAQVLITGRSETSLKDISEKLGCFYITFDVTDIGNIPSFIQKAHDLLGGIDILVNNAGISLHEGSIEYVTEESYDAQFDTNLKAVYFLTKEFLKQYEEGSRKGGSVLLLSSERGDYADDIPYGLIKSAINSLTRGLAKTRIKNNIRINAVAPGVTATEMTGRTRDAILTDTYSTGRFYLPEEVAEVACFLLSDAASCISGQIIVCNNGYSINSYK